MGRHAAVAVVLAAGAIGSDAARAGCPWDCADPPDGIVSTADFLALLAQWGQNQACDFDGGGVGTSDFLALLSHWGPCATGACCLPGSGCMVTTPDDCQAQGGAFGGGESACADTDSDGIPDVFELDDCTRGDACFAGTSPLNPDTDGDGISDGDEFYGTTGGLDLPAMGADPCHKDIFVEMDWVYAPLTPPDDNKPHPSQAARVAAAFAASGVGNPDGVPGIALHIDYGQAPLGGGNSVPDPSGDTMVDLSAMGPGEYSAIEDANFAANRAGYFHYGISCTAYSIDGAYQNSSGLAELLGDEFLVSMGQWATGNDNFIGNTIMHELGHNLGLRHGGDENVNFKPNYDSVMNYWYQFCGTDLNFDVIPDDGLDYSRGLNIDLSESALVEAQGVTGAGPAIDWNKDGDAIDVLSRNINCRLTGTYATSTCQVHTQQNQPCGTLGLCDDSQCTLLNDHDDWADVQLGGLGGGAAAPVTVVHCLLDRPALVVTRPAGIGGAGAVKPGG